METKAVFPQNKEKKNHTEMKPSAVQPIKTVCGDKQVKKNKKNTD